MSAPTERERLARLIELNSVSMLGLHGKTGECALCAGLADVILADGFHREGAPRTPAPTFEQLADRWLDGELPRSLDGGIDEVITFARNASRGNVRRFALYLDGVPLTPAPARSELHNSHPSLDQSAAKSSDAIAGKLGRGEGET